MTDSTIVSCATRSHWIFDLDGTLTVAVHDFAAIRRELSIPDGSDILGHLSSLPLQHSQQLHDRLQQIEEELAAATRAAAGALVLLEHLRIRNARIGILTRNTRENAIRTLELIGLNHFFDYDYILGRDDVAPKPEPDGIYHLARLWDTEPESTVMVGDYQYDLQAGRAAGALTVHVDAASNFRWPELTDVYVTSLDELIP
jgi:HAD superfamily hydrolase (TIGR01549 family)